MKKIIFAAVASLCAAGLMGCASTGGAAKSAAVEETVDIYADVPTTTSTATGVDAIPATELAAAGGIDDEEKNAVITFANAEIGGWALDGGKKYVIDNNQYIKAQNNSTGEEITGKCFSLVDLGNGDKALAVDFSLGTAGRQNCFLYNISNQGKSAYNFTDKVVKIRIYVPEELAYKNADDFNGAIKVQLRNSSWAQMTLGGDLGEFNFKDIGKGWHTLTFNFKDSTFDIGRKQGTFKVSAAAVKMAFSLDLQVVGKAVSSNLGVPFLIDWISITDAE